MQHDSRSLGAPLLSLPLFQRCYMIYQRYMGHKWCESLTERPLTSGRVNAARGAKQFRVSPDAGYRYVQRPATMESVKRPATMESVNGHSRSGAELCSGTSFPEFDHNRHHLH